MTQGRSLVNASHPSVTPAVCLDLSADEHAALAIGYLFSASRRPRPAVDLPAFHDALVDAFLALLAWMGADAPKFAGGRAPDRPL